MGFFNMFSSEEKETAAPSGQTQSPALPSLTELRAMIVKSTVLFRQSIAEAQASAKKARECYEMKFKASAVDRPKWIQRQADLDRMTRQKLAQAQASAKNTAMLQDVEVVMQIDEAFAKCGLTKSETLKSGTIEGLHKALQDASLVVASTMDMVDKMGLAISVPDVGSTTMTPEEREISELWARLDKEADPAKKEEIVRQIQEKDRNAPVQAVLGAV